MGNVFRKNRRIGGRGVARPTRKQIPVVTNGGRGKAQKRPNFQQKNSVPQLGGDQSIVKVCIQRKLGGIGDIIMSTPVLEAFKHFYPNCETTYATQPGVLSDLLKENPHIDHVVDFQKVNREDYHFFSDITTAGLTHENKNLYPRNRIDLFADYVGIRLPNKKPTYIVSKKEKEWVGKILKKQFGKLNGTKLVFLDIASVDPRRTWPVGKYVHLIGYLNSIRNDLKFLVNDHNKRLGRTWDYKNTWDVSQFDLRAKSALVNVCSLFVGPDSGMLHIAGALEKDIVGVFGSTPPMARLNHYKNATAVFSDLPCAGCFYKPCLINIACMKGITYQEVGQAIESRLDKDLVTILDKKITIDIFTLIEPDFETGYLAESLKEIFKKIGFKASLNPSQNNKDALVVDVFKTSTLVRTNYAMPAQGLLRFAFVLIEERKLSREAINRLTRDYDALFVTSKYAESLIIDAGVSKPIYVVDLPLNVSLSRIHNPTKNKLVVGSVVKNVSRSRLQDLIKGTKKFGWKDLQLTLLQDLASGEAPFVSPSVNVVPLTNRAVMHKWFRGIDVYIQLDDVHLGTYLKEAMLYGKPTISSPALKKLDMPFNASYFLQGNTELHNVFYSETKKVLGQVEGFDLEELGTAFDIASEGYLYNDELVTIKKELLQTVDSAVAETFVVTAQKLLTLK